MEGGVGATAINHTVIAALDSAESHQSTEGCRTATQVAADGNQCVRSKVLERLLLKHLASRQRNHHPTGQ